VRILLDQKQTGPEAKFAAIISADLDFVQLAGRLGPPPKVVRIERCEFLARVIEQLLRRSNSDP
jgi:predicted nuclease of predicted toxin-antitoxin system